MAGNIAHGKKAARWCDRCGTLLLGNSCSLCGSSGRIFEINSPGDIRPCFGESKTMILGLFEEAFGTSEPLEGKAVFLNKVPGEDRTDEIIAHGAVLGIARFDMRKNRMMLEIRQPGADFFNGCAKKNIVTFAGMSGHLKGKNIPGSNITEITGEYREGDTLIVRKGIKYGPGIALTDSDLAQDSLKAVKIRDLNPSEDRPFSPDSDRSVFVKANSVRMDEMEAEAVREIRIALKGNRLPVTASFSGGKDSLVAAFLTEKALGKKPILIFINTGLEFPETLEYVGKFSESYDLRTADAGTAFADNVDAFGPPAKDFRWCCKVCKLGPVTELIAKDFPKGTVTAEGNRSAESYSRAGTPLMSVNPFVPGQTNINPVRNWIAAEIWCYIFGRNLPYNPLYDRDFERIGCYMCASCLSSEWRNTGRIHPEMYSRWEEYLHEYAEKRGLPPEYVDMGFWRWKALPPKMVLLADLLDLNLKPSSSSGISMKVLKGASVCEAGGYSAEAVVTLPRNRDFSYTADALRTVGTVKYSPDFDIAFVRTPRGTAKVFGGGQVSVTAKTSRNAEFMLEKTVKAMVRSMMCTSCGICAKKCPRRAIKISGGMRVDPKRCTSCGACERSCMVIHYYDRLTGVQNKEKSGNRRRKT
jgi:phosphoadenosine phosphosulfate reductase